MNFHELIRKNDQEVNKVVSKQLRFIMGLLLFVWVLNMKGIYVIDSQVFNKVMVVSAILLLFPTFIVDVFELQGKAFVYVILSCVILFISVSYMYLTYHMVLMFAIPMVIASLYFNLNVTRFTFVLSVISMVISHVLSYKLRVSPNDPLDTVYEIVMFGLMPRLVELVAYYIVLTGLAKRSSNLLETSLVYADNIKKGSDGIQVIVDKTNEIYAAEGFEELAHAAFTALESLISISGELSPNHRAFFAMSKDHHYFNIMDNDMKKKKIRRLDDVVKVSLDGVIISVPYYPSENMEPYWIVNDYLVIPFYNVKNLTAFLAVHNETKNFYDSTLELAVTVFRGNVLLGIDNIRLKKDMYQTQEELVRAFAEICESKSKQTGQHIKRVSEYTKVLAEAIGLPEREKDNLVIASMMHDIGKLLIPSEILEKNGKLTEQEFDEIKKHVSYGYELLKHSPGRVMEIAKLVALEHHEKWNGKGYLGKKGDEIDFYSRIMAVVDVFDALVSKRSYKKKWTLEDAYNEIVSQSGEHFDPQVVRLFQDNFHSFVEIVETYPDEQEEVS